MVVPTSLLVCVVLQAVTTVEELADIGADRISNDKFATDVLVHEVLDIKNQVIKKAVLLAIGKSLFKLVS